MTRQQDIKQGKAARLSAVQHFAYSAFMLPLSFGFIGLMMFIPAYYAVDMDLGLAAVGGIIALARGFDFFSDPLIGLLSDKTRSRFGRRKPWAAIGLPLFCLAVWGLFQPEFGAGLGYLFVFAILYFAGFTLSELPHASMGLEISHDSHERSWLSAGKMLVFIGGGLVAAAAPVALGYSPKQALSFLARGAAICALPAYLAFLWLTPHRAAQPSQAAAKVNWKALLARRSIGSVIGINFLVQLSHAFSGAMSLLFVAYILGEADKIGLFWVASGLGILIGMPIWVQLGKVMGKLKAWQLSNILYGMALLPLFFLGEGQWQAMTIICALSGLVCAANSFYAQSILADVIDPRQGDHEDADDNNAGLIAASKNATSKIAALAPMAIAFPLLGALGLAASGDAQSILSVSILPMGGARSLLVFFYAGVPLLLAFVIWAWLSAFRKTFTERASGKAAWV